MKELENKVALVSSSTRGIGLACAKALACCESCDARNPVCDATH